ncbi:MAG TPA: Bax inhibitor-1/YccA family protein [Chloroflexota bacterium]|jgi:modulator of FtsH protease|nr:Bax inhibitor-1/YccA family protein [Chloroflexota bacterium]
MRPNPYLDSYTGPRLETTAARPGLLGKVLGLLAFSMAFTAAGAFVGIRLGPALALPATIGMMLLSFVLGFVRNVPGLNLVLMYALTFLAGIALGGIVTIYVAAGAGAVVLQAAATTAVITTGLSIYGLTTRRDFSGMGAKLFFAVLALVAASIVGLFFASSLLQLGIGLAGSVIFSLYILYEVQQARRAEDTLGNAIVIAIGLYLSIFNLFLSLLRVLGLFGSSDE